MRTLSLILISTLLASLLAQDCNNPLLGIFNLPGLDAPASGEGLPFCRNLQNGQSCCSAETVQGFQERLNNLTTSLQSLAGQRDVYLTELYANYSNKFQSVADDLTDYSDEIDRLQRNDAELGNEIRTQYDAIGVISRALDDIDDRFRSSVQDYQKKRADCFTTLLQVQTSAWCLACDPNYANLGVDADGTVTSSADVCNNIQASCAPYLDQADYLNPLFQAQQAYNRLVNLTNYLRDYERNNFVVPANVSLYNDIPVLTNATERTSGVPENCNATSCEWQCANFFSPQYVLNDTIVSNGGGVVGGNDVNYTAIGDVPVVNETVPAENATTTTTTTVDPANEVTNPVTETVTQVENAVAPARLLQQLTENLWNPDLQGTGLTYDVLPDPGDIAAIWNNNPVFDDSDTNDLTDNDNTETDNDDDLTEDNDDDDNVDNDNNANDHTDNNDTDFDPNDDNDNTNNDDDDNDNTNNDDDDNDNTNNDDNTEDN